MKLLLDTHLLLWAATAPSRLSVKSRALLENEEVDDGYQELAITGEHAVTVDALPLIHKDSFDRILVAQAIAEGFTLLTTDSVMAQYPGPGRKI